MNETKKRRLRGALIAIGCVLLLAILTVILLTILLPEDEPAPTPTPSQIRFSPVYDGDIRENEAYLSLNRCYILCLPDYGIKEEIDDSRFASDGELGLIRDYIESLVDGYPNACRSLFTASALEENPIPDFAQQMIYGDRGIEITKETAENGKSVYRLEYMIRQNNGTYRSDVGSDAMRPEYLTVVDTGDGVFRIDGIRR